MTDAAGRIVWSARYRAWGALALADVQEIDNPLRFQGQYHDTETGLHFNFQRFYDPAVGRFVNQDPIGLAGGENVYAYAPNPVGWVDPLGLAKCDVYENPGHHDPSNRGPNPYNASKSVLPENHESLWQQSKPASDGNRWTKIGEGKKAEYHRFQNDGNGNFHWNGSTAGETASGQTRAIRINNVPTEVKRW